MDRSHGFRLRYRQCQHSNIWSWNWWRFWRWKSHWRRPGIWLRCLEAIHAPVNVHHQLLQGVAFGSGYQVWIVCSSMLILLANNARDHDVDNSFYILLRISPNLPFASKCAQGFLTLYQNHYKKSHFVNKQLTFNIINVNKQLIFIS